MTFIADLTGILTKPLLLATCAVIIAAFIWLCKRRKSAAAIALSAAVILFLSTLSPVADALLGPLERVYPALSENVDLRGIAFVAVLGSSYFQRPNTPITAQFDDEGVVRIIEGMRLARSYKLPLLVSGGGASDSSTPANGYARLARDFGIDEDSIIVSPVGTNTRAEVSAIIRIAKGRQFVLVTSASHMPRAMLIFGKGGVVPTPAPTAQRAFRRSIFSLKYWLPSALALRKSELALHEYLGLLEEHCSWP